MLVQHKRVFCFSDKHGRTPVCSSSWLHVSDVSQPRLGFAFTTEIVLIASRKTTRATSLQWAPFVTGQEHGNVANPYGPMSGQVMVATKAGLFICARVGSSAAAVPFLSGCLLSLSPSLPLSLSRFFVLSRLAPSLSPSLSSSLSLSLFLY